MIKSHAHIVNHDPDKFFEKLSDVIDEYQTDSQEVEVQYQMSASGVFSAYVIGRKEYD